MQNLAHADIFFFVTTIAVGVITLGLIVAIVLFVKLLASLNGIVSEAREELTSISDYINKQLKSSESKVGSVLLVAEGLMHLYGSFKPQKSSKAKSISVKKRKS